MVDPDEVRAGHLDRVTAPDVLRVQLGDVEVLEDDVLGAADDAEAFASDDALVADADDGLVRLDINRLGGCDIVGHFDSRVAGAAPVGADESILPFASTGVAVRTAAVFSGCAFGFEEVVLFVEQNHTRFVVGKPRDQLVDIGGNCRCGIATAGDTTGETGSRTYHAGLRGHKTCDRDDAQERESKHVVEVKRT